MLVRTAWPWGGSNEYPQCMFWAEIWKIFVFLSENFQFWEVKFSIYMYLNRCVFIINVMLHQVKKQLLTVFESLRHHWAGNRTHIWIQSWCILSPVVSCPSLGYFVLGDKIPRLWYLAQGQDTIATISCPPSYFLYSSLCYLFFSTSVLNVLHLLILI